jgi:hypothetical protein
MQQAIMSQTNRPMPGHLMIVALLANPMLTQSDIAETCKVSLSTVKRVASMLKSASEDNGIELNAYKMLLREQVPADCRVKTLRKAIDKADSNPFAALKAVEYADNMLGLSPKQQQTQPDSDNTRPMFVLPAGTSISVTVNTPDQAIDVTPGGDEDHNI